MIGLMTMRAEVGCGEVKQKEGRIRLNGFMYLYLYHMETTDSKLSA